MDIRRPNKHRRGKNSKGRYRGVKQGRHNSQKHRSNHRNSQKHKKGHFDKNIKYRRQNSDGSFNESPDRSPGVDGSWRNAGKGGNRSKTASPNNYQKDDFSDYSREYRGKWAARDRGEDRWERNAGNNRSGYDSGGRERRRGRMTPKGNIYCSFTPDKVSRGVQSRQHSLESGKTTGSGDIDSKWLGNGQKKDSGSKPKKENSGMEEMNEAVNEVSRSPGDPSGESKEAKIGAGGSLKAGQEKKGLKLKKCVLAEIGRKFNQTDTKETLERLGFGSGGNVDPPGRVWPIPGVSEDQKVQNTAIEEEVSPKEAKIEVKIDGSEIPKIDLPKDAGAPKGVEDTQKSSPKDGIVTKEPEPAKGMLKKRNFDDLKNSTNQHTNPTEFEPETTAINSKYLSDKISVSHSPKKLKIAKSPKLEKMAKSELIAEIKQNRAKIKHLEEEIKKFRAEREQDRVKINQQAQEITQNSAELQKLNTRLEESERTTFVSNMLIYDLEDKIASVREEMHGYVKAGGQGKSKNGHFGKNKE